MTGSMDPMVEAMRVAMSRSSQGLEATAANLMNLDTPGYRAVEVDFAKLLPSSLQVARTHADHRAAGGSSATDGTVVEAPFLSMRDDGNTVDVDREMMLLAKLGGRYRTSASLIRKRFALWKYAITDGRAGA